MCNKESFGIVQVSAKNPSYCAPLIGPINIDLYSNHTNKTILKITIPEFKLNSGTHVIRSKVPFQLLLSPIQMHQLIQHELQDIQIIGDIPIVIQCLLVPFTVHLQVADLIQRQHASMLTTYTDRSNIAIEIQRIIQAILRTIGLHKVHITQQKKSITAFTDVALEYQSVVHWRIPPIAMEIIDTKQHKTLLHTGFQGFPLGVGKSTISAFTFVLTRDSGPLENMLQSLLTGKDTYVSVTGSDRESNCFVQQVLNEFHVPLMIPGKIHGQPILLQKYNVQILPKKIDSRTKTCNITAQVTLQVNNPLPIDIQVDRVSMEARFRNSKEHRKDFLFGRISQDQTIRWPAHKANNITFSTALVQFNACQHLIRLLFQKKLGVSLVNGKVAMHVAGTSFTIPFNVHDIPILIMEEQAIE